MNWSNGDILRGGLHLPRVLERDDAGERNEMAQRDDLLRLLERAAEAMEDAAHAAGEFAQDCQRVVPRIALVDDGVEAELRGRVRAARGRDRPGASCSRRPSAGFSGR